MRRSNGFTLVELLVVIGIVAILIGFLMPALQRARDQARQVECLTRIRQVAMASIGFYATEYRGAFIPALGTIGGFTGTPPGVNYSMATPSGHVAGLCSGIVGNPYNVMFADYVQIYLDPKNQRYMPGFKQYAQVLYCPADPVMGPAQKVGWWGSGGGNLFRDPSFRLNYDVSPIITTNRIDIGRKVSMVKNASQKVLFAETHYDGAAWYAHAQLTIDPTPVTLTGHNLLSAKTFGPMDADATWYSLPRHKKGLSVAFCDGSARMVSFGNEAAELVGPNPTANVNGATGGTGPHFDLDRP